MRIRRATEQELDRIMVILGDGRAALKRLGIDQWQLGYPHESIVRDDLARRQSYILEDEEGALVATAVAAFGGEPAYDDIREGRWLTSTHSHDASYCTIHRVAVAEQARGRGYGRLLLEGLEALARKEGAESVRIDTHLGNEPMRHLLDSLGYTACGIILIDHAGENTPERIAYEKVIASAL